MVYRLIAKDTVEAKVVEKQESKRALFDAVLGEEDGAQAGPLTADDIRALIA